MWGRVWWPVRRGPGPLSALTVGTQGPAGRNWDHGTQPQRGSWVPGPRSLGGEDREKLVHFGSLPWHQLPLWQAHGFRASSSPRLSRRAGHGDLDAKPLRFPIGSSCKGWVLAQGTRSLGVSCSLTRKVEIAVVICLLRGGQVTILSGSSSSMKRNRKNPSPFLGVCSGLLHGPH